MDAKDRYTWIAIILIAVVAVAVLYFEIYGSSNSNSSASFRLSIAPNNTVTRIYPYQSVFIPVNVTNVGSEAVRDIGVGIDVNGSLTNIYNVSLPSGRSVYINFSKQFMSPGVYNISFVTDPGKFYSLQNRSQATVQFQIIVQAPASPSPASLLPSNWTYIKTTYMDNAGYLTYSYLSSNYSLPSFALSRLPSADAFFDQMLNLTYSYVHSIYAADATYGNASAYAIWIQGSLSGNITAVLAKGLKLNTTYATLSGTTVSVTRLNHNTTLCGMYANGWTQDLVYEGQGNCTAALNSAAAGTRQVLPKPGFLPNVNGSVVISNSTVSSYAGLGFGRMVLLNTSLLYESVQPSTNPSYTCYGPISTVANRIYCTTYLFQRSGSIGPLSLISTRAFVGLQNLTVLALVNTSKVLSQSTIDTGLLQAFNISGASYNFTSGINSTCIFGASLSCYLPVFTNSSLKIRLYNKLNQTFTVSAMACYETGAIKYAQINDEIPALSYSNVTVPCYNNSTRISGSLFGILNLRMNYTISNSMYHGVVGSADIV